jgi:cell division transport system permease protein
MAINETRIVRKKPSAVPGITSLTLVMFMLGLFAFSVLGFEGLSRSLIEGSSMDIYFKDSVSEPEARLFSEKLKAQPWLRKMKFISREEGFKEMGEKYDNEFMDVVVADELPLSVEVYFTQEYAVPEKIEKIVAEISAHASVESISYQRNLVESINKNVRKIQWGLAGLAAVFIFIAIGLINNSTRLNIFASRFLIKSMQLVGATNNFIIRPIIMKFAGYALAAIPFAALMLYILLYGLHYVWHEFGTLHEFASFIHPAKAIIAFGIISISGIFLAAISAWFSTRKYLRTKIENLY